MEEYYGNTVEHVYSGLWSTCFPVMLLIVDGIVRLVNLVSLLCYYNNYDNNMIRETRTEAVRVKEKSYSLKFGNILSH